MDVHYLVCVSMACGLGMTDESLRVTTSIHIAQVPTRYASIPPAQPSPGHRMIDIEGKY